jgi:hypothetical protein
VLILLAVELSKRSLPSKLIIDGCQRMNRHIDASIFATAWANLVAAATKLKSPDIEVLSNQHLYRDRAQA